MTLAGILSDNPLCNSECHVCHYKDIDYSEQLDRKQKWAFKNLQKWEDRLDRICSAPEAERLAYRSKSWMRVELDHGTSFGPSFGMHRSIRVEGRWKKEFVSWNTCPLHSIPIQQMTHQFREFLAPLGSDFLESALVGVWFGSPHLVIVSPKPESHWVKEIDWKKILIPPFDQVWFHCNSQVGKNIFGHRPIEPVFSVSFNESVAPSLAPGAAHPIRAFRQNAQTLLKEARHLAVSALIESQPTLILDLYCGTGDLAVLLPAEIGWVGIEISPDAVKYAQTLRDPSRSVHAAFIGSVEQRLRDPRVLKLLTEPYALYLNPPRSGLSEELREILFSIMRENPPSGVSYLSCSASSLARDLARFEVEGYRVRSLKPFDFFPQTEHFELLAVLDRV